MNTRTGLKRCDTRWPQTLQMSRRAMRTPQNAYRRKQPQPRIDGSHPTDWVILALFVGVVAWLWWPALRQWWGA